ILWANRTIGASPSGKAADFGSATRRFESYRPSHCLVSRHPGRLSQDIMDRPASVEGLVVAGWVNRQRAEQLALLGHDPDLRTSHEDVHRRMAVSRSNADVSQAAAVAQGDGAGLVDAVVTDAV